MNCWPDCALEEEMLTIRPQPASSMSGSTAWMQWKTPFRLTSITRTPRNELGAAVSVMEISLPNTRIILSPSEIPEGLSGRPQPGEGLSGQPQPGEGLSGRPQPGEGLSGRPQPGREPGAWADGERGTAVRLTFSLMDG